MIVNRAYERFENSNMLMFVLCSKFWFFKVCEVFEFVESNRIFDLYEIFVDPKISNLVQIF